MRCFEDPDVTHVDGSIDPLRDAATIETELALADLDTVERRLERVRRSAKTPGKEGEAARAELELLERLSTHLSAGEAARTLPVADDVAGRLPRPPPADGEARALRRQRRRGGPRRRAPPPRPWSATPASAAPARSACARSSSRSSRSWRPEEKEAFLAELGLKEPGLDRLARAAYALLDLITFLTAGPKEVRAWTVRRGTRRAARPRATIHSDFERTFIRAEVIPFDDYVACGGEAGARAKGKLRVEGKEYVVQDGDVLHFRVGA